jgi:hypothetical protein
MKTPPLSVLLGRGAMACAAIALSTSAHAWPATYRMTTDAAFVEGCFGLCACPLWFSDLIGTFRLHPVTLGGTIDIFAVTNVDWLVTGSSEDVSGDGTYTLLNQVAALNSMDLDLQVGPDRVDHFSSGNVLVGGAFPTIIITVSKNMMSQCFDTVFEINAQPALGDVTGDVHVDADDLLAVIQGWGACDPLPAVCEADISPAVIGNGTVNVDDLLMVVSHWGQ